MINITITPQCGSLGLETAPVVTRIIKLVWEWVVFDVETLLFEEELILYYESQGPPPACVEINCNYTDSGSSRYLSFCVFRRAV